MNERIQELEIQCWEPRQYGPSWFNSTKFAELVIEQCISQCWTVSELEHNGYVVSECSKRVRKHFGVEV